MTEPRKVLPFAFAGICHVQTTALPCTRASCARSRALPARPTHVTRPFWSAAPVSERAATIRSVNVRPALGALGVPLSERTTSVGLATMTWYG